MPMIPLDILNHWAKIWRQADESPWEPIWSDKLERDWSGQIRCGLDGTMDQTVWEPEKGDNKLNAANIRFICSARTALPLAITEIHNLRAELHGEQTKVEELKTQLIKVVTGENEKDKKNHA